MKPLHAADGWEQMAEQSQDEFNVVMKHGAGHYADRPVTLQVRDPDHRLDMSAVNAACVLTRKSIWRRLGGMDEES
ncbi:hypothetical protein N182_32975 [Sinorhizobium sp. GL2]|nr:hypothetical protein N182_32975 [Sinorhizobium sp. GL2]